jgi:hypothetical protein
MMMTGKWRYSPSGGTGTAVYNIQPQQVQPDGSGRFSFEIRSGFRVLNEYSFEIYVNNIRVRQAIAVDFSSGFVTVDVLI